VSDSGFDIRQTVQDLRAAGVVFQRYEGMKQDDDGISDAANPKHNSAWMRRPKPLGNSRNERMAFRVWPGDHGAVISSTPGQFWNSRRGISYQMRYV
jgi:hypothetical protein